METAVNRDVDKDDFLEEEELVPEDDAIIGRAFRWSLLIIGVIGLAVIGIIVVGSERAPGEVVRAVDTRTPDALVQALDGVPEVVFRDITRESGVSFIHENGADGRKLLPETMGGGVAFLDYDGDGDQDLLFVNSSRWETAPGETPATMVLYANDGEGNFTDVTAEANLDVSFYGMGVAVGDYDNDGDVDLFFTAVGENRLFENAEGKFIEVTSRAGVGGSPEDWATGAAFFDYDNDGYLDLFVCNYVVWSPEIDFEVGYTLNGVDRAYGPPTNFVGTFSYLYRNNGDGTFTDVSEEAGVQVTNPATGRPLAKALAVLPIDLDHDGWIDLIVANDTVQNFLFHNQRDGTFLEAGMESGIAFDFNGKATGAMGIDGGYVYNDQALGIGIGNFANEMTSLYLSQEDPLWFADESIGLGIGSPSRLKLTFGLFFFDYDLDGRLDLLQANGHLEEEISQVQASQEYRQPAQLFWNRGGENGQYFVETPADQVGDLSRPIVGRGASYADIDGDGDLDVVLTEIAGPPLLLRNEQELQHNWLRVKLTGSESNRDAIGAIVRLTADGTTQIRQVMPTRSYLSQVELPVTFGLGSSTVIDSLEIEWPGGSIQQVADVSANTTLHVLQE